MTNETKQLAEELLEEILNSVFIMRYDKQSKTSIRYAKIFMKDLSFYWYKEKLKIYTRHILDSEKVMLSAIEDSLDCINISYRLLISRYDKLSPEEKITYGKPFISKQLLKLVQQGHL